MKTIFAFIMALHIMTALHAQNVGIGTENPGATFHVVGDVITEGQHTITGSLGLHATPDNIPLDIQAEYEQVGLRLTGISPYTRMQIQNNGVHTEMGSVIIDHEGYIGTTSDHSFGILSGNVKRIFIQSGSGNVGIGTINPTKKLQVAGDISGINIFGYTLSATEIQAEHIHQDEPSTVDFYISAFSHQGFPYENVTYYKDKEGRVHLSGIVAISGTQTGTMFILPEGCRPQGNVVFCAMTSSGNGHRINVNSTGNVTIQGNLSGWVSMNGISFRAN